MFLARFSTTTSMMAFEQIFLPPIVTLNDYRRLYLDTFGSKMETTSVHPTLRYETRVVLKRKNKNTTRYRRRIMILLILSINKAQLTKQHISGCK